MSNQQDYEDEGPTAEEGLKFVAFFFKTYEEENDAYLSVNSDLFNEIVLDDSGADVNLVFEKIDDRVIIRAVTDEDE